MCFVGISCVHFLYFNVIDFIVVSSCFIVISLVFLGTPWCLGCCSVFFSFLFSFSGPFLMCVLFFGGVGGGMVGLVFQGLFCLGVVVVEAFLGVVE